MNLVVNIILIALVFGIVISFHEFGHFLLAKINGVRVNEFAIGMGPTLFHFTKGDTKYSLKLLPIGGYCAMMGEDELVEDPKAFSCKNVWQRIMIVLAGPFFNFILAFAFSLILIGMIGYSPTEIDNVIKNSAAEEAGLQAGDKIIKIDGSRVYIHKELLVYMQFYQGDKPVELVVKRNNEKINITLTPTLNDSTGAYMIGVEDCYYEPKNPIKIVEYSAYEVRYWIKTTIMSLSKLITGKVSVKNLSGPVGIASMMNDTYTEAKETGGAIDVFLNFINFCILLSANLGVMNLLPIPALDGGRFLFLLVEAITRKRIPAEKEALIHMIGFVFLMILMVVVLFHDIFRVFF